MSCLLTGSLFFSAERLSTLWRPTSKDIMTLSIPENCAEFKQYYDSLQEKISHLSVLDELLSGEYMLNKCLD